MSHTIAFLAYPGFQILDVTGPAAVFHEANHVRRIAGAAPFYRIVMLSSAGGLVASSSGIELSTLALARMPAPQSDTLLIAGASEEPLMEAIAIRLYAAGCRAARGRQSDLARFAPARSSSRRWACWMESASPRTGRRSRATPSSV